MNKQDTDTLLSLEASVLGAILVRNEVLAELPTLEPDDFYDFKHRAVFVAMRNLEARSPPRSPRQTGTARSSTSRSWACCA
jgi:replicative DNA helicase